MKEYFVYILRRNDGTYYTGITNDIQKRFAQHQAGIDPDCYTHRRLAVTLAYVASFSDVQEAIAWEKQVKGWSRKKKEALIQRKYEQLPALAKKEFRKQ